MALLHLERAGATVLQRGGKLAGIPVDGLVQGANGKRFCVLAHGNLDDGRRAGLRRTDTVRKAGNSAFLLHEVIGADPLLLVTSHLPQLEGRSRQAAFLLALHGRVIFDAVATSGDLAGFHRLRRYMTATPAPDRPEPAPWRRLPDEQLVLGLDLDWRPGA